MNKLTMAVLSVVGMTSASFGAAFTAGDLAVFAAGPGNNAGAQTSAGTNISILELNSSASSTTPVDTIDISGSSNPLFIGGSASSNGFVASSNDRSQLLFAGFNSKTTGTENTVLGRSVGVLSNNKTYTIGTTYTGTTGNQTRGAATINDTNYAIADQNGIYTNGATAASPSGVSARSIKAFGGNFYVSIQSSTTTNKAVNTLSALSGGTLTGLPGLTNDNTISDFYLVSSTGSATAFDTLYYATTAGISKFGLTGGSWTSEGTAAVSGGFFGIAAQELANNAGVALYLTTGTGGVSGNSVVKYVDSAAYNSTLALGSATNLYTASSSTVLKGLDFAPTAVPEPATLALAGLGSLTMLRRRRSI